MKVASVEMSISGGFGMGRIKKAGAALHPDDIEVEMTPEQEARQLAAYALDTGDVPVWPGRPDQNPLA
jgi:hypothetical protein